MIILITNNNHDHRRRRHHHHLHLHLHGHVDHLLVELRALSPFCLVEAAAHFTSKFDCQRAIHPHFAC